LVVFLYASNLTQEILALLFGVSKGTIHNWIYRICNDQLPAEILSRIQYWSGGVRVDEKWLKVNGVWHFALCAVDAATGFPLLIELYPSIDAVSWSVFFKKFKSIYGVPKFIKSTT
jgi:transposase-like protein